MRITEVELARAVRAVLAQDHRPIAVMKQPRQAGRNIDECIELARAYEAKLGYAPVPDVDFARDVQAGIDSRRETVRNVWDE